MCPDDFAGRLLLLLLERSRLLYMRRGIHREPLLALAGSGRPPELNENQMAELRALVLEGPDLARDGVVCWRCADLRAEIAAVGR